MRAAVRPGLERCRLLRWLSALGVVRRLLRRLSVRLLQWLSALGIVRLLLRLLSVRLLLLLRLALSVLLLLQLLLALFLLLLGRKRLSLGEDDLRFRCARYP